ncbi:MAG: hypothetical protein ABIK28_02575 [Planctomycetota bacterium]
MVRLEYEGASTIRDLIRFATRFNQRQAFIHCFKSEDLVIREQGAHGITHRFSKGCYLFEHPKPFSKETRPDRSERDDTIHLQPEDDRFLLDRANLVLSWLKRNEGSCSYEFSTSHY